jgi:hypothetical protein
MLTPLGPGRLCPEEARVDMRWVWPPECTLAVAWAALLHMGCLEPCLAFGFADVSQKQTARWTYAIACVSGGADSQDINHAQICPYLSKSNIVAHLRQPRPLMTRNKQFYESLRISLSKKHCLNSTCPQCHARPIDVGPATVAHPWLMSPRRVPQDLVL